MSNLNPDTAQYRQPMVTSIGIIMGFLLNFIANWATTEDGTPALNSAADYLVAGTMLVSIALMIYVLSRLLNNRFNPETVGAQYQLTFKLYLACLLLAFSGFGAALLL
jgi:uncharacterized membrane protein